MATTIWILKWFIALLFTFTGSNKIVLPKTKLLDIGMKGLIDLEEQQIKVVGFLEILGALGLILPTLLNIYPVISVVAASCLGLTMIVAGWIHLKLKLSIIPNIAVFVICIVVAYCEAIYGSR
jgi:hypothetical protein